MNHYNGQVGRIRSKDFRPEPTETPVLVWSTPEPWSDVIEAFDKLFTWRDHVEAQDGQEDAKGPARDVVQGSDRSL